MPSEATYERELANLRKENEYLRGRLSHFSALSLKIASSLDLETVLQEVVDSACDLTGARYGAIGVFDEQGHVQAFLTHGITAEERERLGDLPKGLGLLGVLQRDQRPLRLADLARHPRSVGFPPHHPPMRSFLGVPIRLGEEGLGNIYLTEKVDAGEFAPEDEDALVMFASQAALAIHNARQYEALRDEQQRLDTLVRLSPAGVLMIEAGSQKLMMANREAGRIMGFSRRSGEVLDNGHQALNTAPDGTELDDDSPLLRALTKGETVRAEEVVYRSSGGRAVPALVSAAPILGYDGDIVAAMSVIQDISPLEELERLKSEFLGIVSHELRTPLTAIKGSAATVLGSDHPFDEKEIEEFFQIVDEQADRMRDLINNLLDVTRIEAGALSVRPDPFDLAEALEEARETFAGSGGYQTIDLILPEDRTVVLADRRRVSQVLDNLLSNAGKFSPQTSTITLEVESDAEKTTVHVRDEGRGIAPADLPHVFRKFYQARGEQGSGFRGSGLGLAICKGIVEAHGGRIWTASAGEGKGTTFSFTLPIAPEAQEPRLADVSRRTHHIGKVTGTGTKTKILAVDDELQTLRYIQNTLNRAGYSPIVTTEPSEALGLIEMEQPQLVLLDLMFPRADGFELLRRIRAASGVLVICLTARDDEDTIVKTLRLGADDYVTKPFSPSELIARIEASLRRRVLVDQMEVRARFELEDMTIDFAARRVSVSGEEVSLTPTEYKLLSELASNAGRVLTHDEILRRVWGPEYFGESHLVRAIVRNLRRKLGDSARNPRFIFTMPQVGYRMAKPPSA